MKFLSLFIVLCFVACGDSQKPPTSPNNPDTAPTPVPGPIPIPTPSPTPEPEPTPAPSPIANCDANVVGSLLADCNKEHRACAANAQGAACSDCAPGFVNDNNTCEPIALCSDASCDAQNRECNENKGRALCTECLDGYGANSRGDCVATCDVKHCSPSQICVPVFDAAAICADTAPAIGSSTVAYPACGANKAWYPSQELTKQGCKTCDPCIGRGVTTRLYPVVNQEGQCVCETNDGYFYDPGTHQVTACDADGDGWVRYTAKRAMDTKNCTGSNCDWVVSDNARCHVRTIDTVVLESETGFLETLLLKDEPLVKTHLENGVLPLYEAETNDDLSLRPIPLEPILPKAGRAFTSGELNSFTKACVNDTADFNDNHIADIVEYQGMNAPAASGNVDVTWLEPYTALAYFTELYKGTYVAKGNGEYHITERTRLASANALPFTWSTDKERTCYRGVDTNYFNVGESPTKPKIGLDFARYNDMQTIPRARIAEFAHYSQFRCVQIVTDALDATTRSLAPQKINVDDNEHSLQTCTLTSNQNQFICNAVSKPTAGFVGWSLAKYQDYGNMADYVRGCINECVDRSLLPTPQTCPNEQFGATCHGDTNNFGAFACDAIACGSWFFDRDGDGYAYYQSPSLCYAPKVDPDGKPLSIGNQWIRSNTNLERGDCDNDSNRSPAKGEICDGIDNNCDGNTDEGFHVVRECEIDNNCENASTSYDHLTEICDGFDNNCVGGIDEGFHLGEPCSVGLGFCQRTGNVICTGQTSGCGAPVVEPLYNFKPYSLEMPDKSRTWDNNCDGIIEPEFAITNLDLKSYTVKVFNTTRSFYTINTFDFRKICSDISGGFPARASEVHDVEKALSAQRKCSGPNRDGVFYFAAPGEDGGCGSTLVKVQCKWDSTCKAFDTTGAVYVVLNLSTIRPGEDFVRLQDSSFQPFEHPFPNFVLRCR
jgi:hypothetical protein